MLGRQLARNTVRCFRPRWRYNGLQAEHYSKSTRKVSLKGGKNGIVLPTYTTVSQLATLLRVRFVDLQKQMGDLGFAENGSDQIIADENAQIIADEMGIQTQLNEAHGEDIWPQPPSTDQAPPRPPIVALMGHVDHGKTTILDYVRKSHIADGEKGGITQHIGAFLVPLRSQKSQKVCFLDTPGHEAFLKLRQRGSNATDIVLLVVAADDSVMPQTREAIKHAQAAGVPMVVALTKSDRPDADPDRVIADLAASGVDVEAYGGETQCIPISAPTGKGMDDLEAALIALLEVLDIRAPQDGPVEGVVVESQQVKGLGNAATVIVRRGTLKPRSFFVAGKTWAKVKQIQNDAGKSVNEALPGTPVRITGWKDLPEPGDIILEAKDEEHAKRVSANRHRLEEQSKEAKQVEVMNENRRLEHEETMRRAEHDRRAALGLSTASSEAAAQKQDGIKTVLYLIKADVGGSAEALADCIGQLGNDEVKAEVLSSGVGAVTESDVFRAESSGASIIAFATSTMNRPVDQLASRLAVPILRFDVIYTALQAVKAELEEKLTPQYSRKILSEAEIRQVFRITLKKGSFRKVAGVKVSKGSFTLRSTVQVRRGKEVVYEGKLSSIQHGKDSTDEAHKGSEYGVGLESWDKFEEGDIIEAYEDHRIPRHL